MLPRIDGAATSCPRFYSCGAAICPLDPNWRKAVHLNGEPVCYYALQSGKVGATERYAGEPAFAAVSDVLPEVLGRHPDIRQRVNRAARHGFPGANAANIVRNTRVGAFIGHAPSRERGLDDPEHVHGHLLP
jgi:hypothetical protein